MAAAQGGGLQAVPLLLYKCMQVHRFGLDRVPGEGHEQSVDLLEELEDILVEVDSKRIPEKAVRRLGAALICMYGLYRFASCEEGKNTYCFSELLVSFAPGE